ncbi:glycoside hydrolase [Pararhizobium sp. BT-229]|uniref:glycoside hydrolase n=1 Tax=Pararhizobium sp. BT-229 TaxID=2986923 RepID=UPI0021F73BED|nr:glycoside hydrolase [Pararhizobium sp. BT-229]MCV9961823.1 glycoside hydrolase [Pararhizobium sp. BT-229]
MKAVARVRLACALAALWAFAPAPPANADDAVPDRIGINRVNLAWLSRADQERVLREIAASGITHVRLSLSRPVDKSIEALEMADRLGLKILLEIQLGNKDYYPPETRPRTGFGRIWDVQRLSDLDLDLYRAQLRSALRRIDGMGIRIDAVEPGNEINYSAYNGDLVVYEKPGRQTPRSVSEVADRPAFERGLDAYVDAVRITREELRATVHSRGALLISAGLSDVGTGEADRRGMERLDPDEFLSLLRERGIDALVDGYGIHLYPGRKGDVALARYVTALLDFCQPEGHGKPCWVTEWGIANTALSCPVDDREREGAIRATRRSFAALMEEGRLDAAFYYDWDAQPVYSVWRCGALSPAGVAATEANTGEGSAR